MTFVELITEKIYNEKSVHTMFKSTKYNLEDVKINKIGAVLTFIDDDKSFDITNVQKIMRSFAVTLESETKEHNKIILTFRN